MVQCRAGISNEIFQLYLKPEVKCLPNQKYMLMPVSNGAQNELKGEEGLQTVQDRLVE